MPEVFVIIFRPARVPVAVTGEGDVHGVPAGLLPADALRLEGLLAGEEGEEDGGQDGDDGVGADGGEHGGSFRVTRLVIRHSKGDVAMRMPTENMLYLEANSVIWNRRTPNTEATVFLEGEFVFHPPRSTLQLRPTGRKHQLIQHPRTERIPAGNRHEILIGLERHGMAMGELIADQTCTVCEGAKVIFHRHF